MAKLGDICEIISGSTPKTNFDDYWGGEYCWITPAELSENSDVIYDTERKITNKGAKSCSLTLMPIGTVLLSSRAPIGKIAITGTEMYCNQGFKNLVCSDVIYNRYLYWFLKNSTLLLNSLGRGATFKEISKKIVSDIEISLYPLETQHQIASTLDKVTHTIDLCNQIIEKLDLLVKARFVEMFGDPVHNTKKLKTKTGRDIFKLSNGKIVPEEKRIEIGIPAYGGNGISCFTDKSLCNNDTLVIGRVGFQSGNVHFVKSPLWITDNAMYISELLDKEYNLKFLFALMKHIDFTRFQDAGDLKKITQKPFMNMEYITPHIEQQLEYVSFVEQTEKSKSIIKQLLEKAETLKKALMQEYFG